ncbi:MAG: Uma2 family endonuclease [Acidobacteria bacterium]|nr:Uma2 family endonuclease [Acidobacteriota bacterium]
MPATALMTVEEFLSLPESGPFLLELRNGEVVKMTRPARRHDDRVYQIRRSLQTVAQPLGYLKEEFSYRPLPEHEFRVADLGFAFWERWDEVPDDGNLIGAPDFIVEVASPSNTAEELQEKREISLVNGCREFWIVYPKLALVEVATGEGTRTYRTGDSIPLAVFPGHRIAVSWIFARPSR